VGVDIIEIQRLKAVWKSRGRRFLDRIFTQAEKDYCLSKKDPAPHLAARFAAKEALLKAVGAEVRGLFKWPEISVSRRADEPPAIILAGRAAAYFKRHRLKPLSLSLSHSRDYAVAVALVGRKRRQAGD
jgi:holo-[acyl-carrier protein] synthase